MLSLPAYHDYEAFFYNLDLHVFKAVKMQTKKLNGITCMHISILCNGQGSLLSNFYF